MPIKCMSEHLHQTQTFVLQLWRNFRSCETKSRIEGFGAKCSLVPRLLLVPKGAFWLGEEAGYEDRQSEHH